MARNKRGPDRRAPSDVRGFPLHLPGGVVVDDDRREGGERRESGFISQQELFKGVDYEDLERVLVDCPVLELDEEQVLLSVGKENHHLYILLRGELEVRLDAADSPHGFALPDGQCVGEMSIIDGEPVSAYVVAKVPSAVLAIHDDVFWSRLASLKGVARNMLHILSDRMRRQTRITLEAQAQRLKFEHLERELGVAQQIQASMLPHGDALFPEHDSVDVFAMMDPAREVGGDLFDAFPVDATHACIAVGDVCGKGMPAALFMVRTVTLLRLEMLTTGDLGKAIHALNEALCDQNESNMFVTMFVGVLDVESGVMEYVNIGHNPPLISRGGGDFDFLDMSRNLIAGISEEAEYQVDTMQFAPGDSLLLYTDGVSEAKSADGRFYGEGQLRQYASTLAKQGASGMVNGLRHEVAQFASGAEQSDDITVMAVRFLGH